MGAGIFQKHNLELQTVYTSGGGETPAGGHLRQRRYRRLARHAGRARRLRQGRTGARDRRRGDGTAEYYFVKMNSPVQKDFKGVTPNMTLAYSTNGSGTHITALPS